MAAGATGRRTPISTTISTTSSTAPCPVIALASSAGGLAATVRVLSRLPADLPAAIITVQHMVPDADSRLPQILAASTALAVVAAQDGQALEPGAVYVAPPGQHTMVTADHRLAMVASDRFPPHRPSADLLLTTLAMAAGDQAIAAVLTGGGKDAAVGAAVVHRQGGAVLATDEESSESFAMPSATIQRADTGAEVVALDALPARLVDLARSAAARHDRAG